VGISLQNRQRFPNKAVGLASRRHVGWCGGAVLEVGGPESVPRLPSLRKYWAEAGTTQMKAGVQTTDHLTSHANSPRMNDKIEIM
jgi:hypothetical protein